MKINFILLFQMAFVVLWLNLYTLNALSLGANIYTHKPIKNTLNRAARRKYIKVKPRYKKA